MGRISIPQDICLHNILCQCFNKIKGFFALNDPSDVLAEPPSLDRILSCIFDTTSLLSVTETSASSMDDHDKACLFVQAVAGMVLFFRRIASACADTSLSACIFARELQLFAESEERRALLDGITASPVLHGPCYTKAVLADFLEEVIDYPTESTSLLPDTTMRNDFPSDPAAWVSDRPCKHMGLPWGFTIMALN